MKALLIDNYDSFTYMLDDYIRQCGVECVVERNDRISFDRITDGTYQALVLSPGPGTPGQSGELMKVIAQYHAVLPVLGVCLGHQAIGEFFGCRLIRAKKPMHGKITRITHLEDPLFNGIPEVFEATRYHSLVLESDNHIVRSIASAEDGEIMAIRHNALPVWGVQFHPESCLTTFGQRILQNFLEQATGKC